MLNTSSKYITKYWKSASSVFYNINDRFMGGVMRKSPSLPIDKWKDHYCDLRKSTN